MISDSFYVKAKFHLCVHIQQIFRMCLRAPAVITDHTDIKVAVNDTHVTLMTFFGPVHPVNALPESNLMTLLCPLGIFFQQEGNRNRIFSGFVRKLRKKIKRCLAKRRY